MIGTTLALSLGGERVLTRVEGDEELLHRLRVLYDHPPQGRGDPVILVRWTGRRGEVCRRGRRVFGGRDRAELSAWAEWVATIEVLFRAKRSRLLVHAAWAAGRRASALLAGPHGSGKTTLAAALVLRHGGRLMADDMVLLSSRGRVRAVERPVRIKPGSARLLPELPGGVYPLSRFGPRRPAPRLSRIYILEPPTRAPLSCVRLPEGIALARLAMLTRNFRSNPALALPILARSVRSVPVDLLSGGTLDERSRAVARTLEEPEVNRV